MKKKAVPLKGKAKYQIVMTMDGSYAIQRLNREFPWPERWGFANRKEALSWVKKLNSGRYKLRFLTKGLKKVV